MMMHGNGYQTIQRRHSEKWLAKVRNLKSFELSTNFRGDPVPDDKAAACLRWSIEKMGSNLQVNAERTKGRLRDHSNSWCEFDLIA